MQTKPQMEEPSPDNVEQQQQDQQILISSTSPILPQLPHNTHLALQIAPSFANSSVTIRLVPLPNTPSLSGSNGKQIARFTCSTSHRFERIVNFIRKRLKLLPHESLFCYVNSVFAPGLDEVVGNLWECFRTGNYLVMNYSLAQAFG
ncbi:Ubiquitin-like protein ATG12 [Cercospora beticola]|uniref:Ubiquitin-like protein ATG12 n=1 Tax=Cercospora beticola TaxID=122368 RepID=A0A2G5IAA9_CERBT|nr:Ubiquitin-like protein ATG12 [Cercospora beticola]PIB01725.1 Ubiquitin-like protein ATG12 [Cercospora beticola]WPA95464.1 hypothetical protein RHO25_000063 [Cercospora beticola]